MEKLQTALSFGGILAKEHIAVIIPHFEKRILKAGEDFLSVGKIAREIVFINKGILRSYNLSDKGQDITKYFIRENQFFVDIESYYNQTPAVNAWQAVVETELFVVGKSSWDKLMQEIPSLFILTKTLTEAGLLNKIKDNDFLHYGTAAVKYKEFISRYPDLALQVPQQYIASYLKITPQSLSRLRRNHK